MNRPPPAPSLWQSLSARLLVLTIAFVLLSEVLIFPPSIARFRQSWLEDRLDAAGLALLVLEATPDAMVSQDLADRLLGGVGAFSAMPEDSGTMPPRLRGVLTLAMPPAVETVIDLDETGPIAWMADAFHVLLSPRDRVVTVWGRPPATPDQRLGVTLGEGRLHRAIVAYGVRVAQVSLVISLISAGLVFASLQWLLVRPMRGLVSNMMAFRAEPEAAGRVIRPSLRADEIGQVERELASLQETVRQALRQRARLAALGTAVGQVNHDLRSILATARLVSDRLAEHAAPEVRRAAGAVMGAIDRAVTLCTGTLAFAGEMPAPLVPTRFGLGDLVAEVAGGLDQRLSIEDRSGNAELIADRAQLYRVLLNLMRNAAEAGATRLSVSAGVVGEAVEVELADDGPGLPPRARAHLFQPFIGSARPGGTGLGLAICREILRAHGGEITLVDSAADGTRFRLTLPRQPA